MHSGGLARLRLARKGKWRWRAACGPRQRHFPFRATCLQGASKRKLKNACAQGVLPRLKIGIDAKFASSRYGGMGAYILHIIEVLAHLGQDDIIMFVPSEVSPELELSTHAQCLKIQQVFTKKKSFQDVYDLRAYWEQEVLPAQLEKHAVDMFFGPAFMAPPLFEGFGLPTIEAM